MSQHLLRRLVLAAMLILFCSLGSYADTYYSAGFTGGVFKPDGFAGTQWGPTVSGNFVYDATQAPGAGSGYWNVFFSGFPDIASIPAPTAFSIQLSPSLSFTLDNAYLGSAAVQYNNGAFNGFFFVSQFQYQGSDYEFDDQGGTWSIYTVVGGNNTFQQVASGYIDIGNGSLRNLQPYTPPITPTPEPSAILMLSGGLLGLAPLVRRKLYR